MVFMTLVFVFGGNSRHISGLEKLKLKLKCWCFLRCCLSEIFQIVHACLDDCIRWVSIGVHTGFDDLHTFQSHMGVFEKTMKVILALFECESTEHLLILYKVPLWFSTLGHFELKKSMNYRWVYSSSLFCSWYFEPWWPIKVLYYYYYHIKHASFCMMAYFI